MKRWLFPLLFSAVLLCGPASHAVPFDQPYALEDMTSQEVRKRIDEGAATVIVPTGGTEQNGPAIVTGKHNFIIHYTAGEIARGLGDALVAPVIAYVPEGRIDPAEGHMRFAGTLSVSESTFGALLEDTARSLKQHGFRWICFVGEHGGSQEVQKRIAEKLSAEWRGQGVRVLHIGNYYEGNGQAEWVREKKLEIAKPEAHAGFFDASEMLALEPGGVRKGEVRAYREGDYAKLGAAGDETTATAEYGRALLALKVNAAIAQIRHERTKH